MKTIITVSLTLLVSSVFGVHEVCLNTFRKQVNALCTKSENMRNVIESRYPTSEYLELRLMLKNNLTIAPHTFKNSPIRDLRVGIYDGYPRSRESVSLNRDSFAGMAALEILEFYNINLGMDYETALTSLASSLVTLNIRDTNLTKVPIKMLASLPNINHLGLPKNSIYALFANSFSSLTSLKALDLTDNRIYYIQEYAFRGLGELQHLDLWGNSIDTIPKGQITNLTSLKTLDLRYCGITRIEAGAFSGFNLHTLSLASNQIEVIKTDTFIGLSVKFLHLQDNHIKKLEPRAFNGINNTIHLNLTGNHLRRIDSDDFEGFTTKYLVLSNNRIEMIAPNALKNVVTQRIDLYDSFEPMKFTVELGLPESVQIRRN